MANNSTSDLQRNGESHQEHKTKLAENNLTSDLQRNGKRTRKSCGERKSLRAANGLIACVKNVRLKHKEPCSER